jgi:DMSO/TMAO reductase YedYZ molybdopterin-dependent catalytic subunit
LLDFVRSRLPAGSQWSQVEVISADGFGNRVMADELVHPSPPERPIILSYQIDGRRMTRQQGLVRMIVPSETDDALRQVKWIGRIEVRR